jgi:hypothetical protein
MMISVERFALHRFRPAFIGGGMEPGFIGVCLGVAYIVSGFNLWLPILVHGMINTVELILMSRGTDQRLRPLIWKKSPET